MTSREFTILICVIVMVMMMVLGMIFLIIEYAEEKMKFKKFIEREKIENETKNKE